ncbi:RecA-like DNA recombinase [Gordonia phage Yakult]|nr:RecA-like DNA recombinase [Gordonia phage Yakult]
MTDNLTRADAQLRVLKRVWSSVKRGYVFLPWIPAEAARSANRRESWHEGPAFRWPDDAPAIREHLAEHADDDLYFAPMVFSENERRSEYAMSGNRLWADMDEANPTLVDDTLKPTVAWETSPGRYAAVWALTEVRSNTAAPGRENHRLTSFLEADPSGWDATQLLRVPLSANNKPAYPEGTRGVLLWKNGPTHDWDAFDALPEVKVAHVESNIDEQVLEGIDRHEVWARVKRRVNRNVRQYMLMRETGGLDRSEVAWQIERELADAGCTVGEIVAVVRPTVWNKFSGRQDEVKRLLTEASKAISLRGEEGEAFEPDDALERPDKLKPFWEVPDYLDVPEPEWLVPQMIPKGGCGFIAGIPKSLKSWMALDLAISLTTGEDWLGHTPATVNVLYIQEEDPAILVRDRHNTIASSKSPKWALSETMSEVRRYPANLYMQILEGFNGTDDGWQTWLSDMVREYDVSMVIFDTLATIAPGVDIDSGREVKGDLLDPLKGIARETGAAMLIVHHMTKAGSNERAGQNMAGSGQIHAWADFGLYVTNKDEKTGTVTLTFNHETKYTGTNTHKFSVDGLDDKRWNPVMHSAEDAGTDAEVTTQDRGGHIAFMRERVPVINDVDPLSPDVAKTMKLRRAYVKWAVEQGQTSLKQIGEDMGVKVASVQKIWGFLVNDYEGLSEAFPDVR